MAEKTEIKKVTTPEFRVSFPAVFEPSGMQGQEKKYSVTMLFDKKAQATPEYKALVALIRHAVEEKFPDASKRPKGLKNPLRNGSEKEQDGYADTMFCTARSKTKPGLVDAQLQAIISAEEFYPGCYARATVNAFYYDQAGNKGVGLGLQNIQKLRDGEPFSGRSKAEDDFGAVEGQESTGAAPVDEDTFAA
jgi:hypothetical protein